MSDFIVSARKYRPTNFESIVGQSSITSTLQNAIKTGQLAQSFLFCGPRGVGKTTCARIFAKQINQYNKEDDIDDFSFNIFELDAASNNSVDDIRNLTDQVRVPPQIGTFKVYIIDEVHMLSVSAFNAFLKTLEEPPKHAKFILATTEKHKIIPTILSRCQIFDFKRVGVNDIANHLDYVAKSEGVVAENEALHLIAQKSDGSVRDALSLFDRLISFDANQLTHRRVIEHLNILDTDYYFKITDCLLNNDIKKLLNIFNDILENGFDGHHFINGLAEHMRDLLVSKDESTILLLQRGEDLKNSYLEQSKRCDLNFLLPALNLCNECDLQFKTTSNQRLLVELTLIRISSIETEKEKKKTKSFSVNRDEKQRKIFIDKIKNNDKKEISSINKIEESSNIKLEKVSKKRSSLISINSSLKEEKEILQQKQISPVLRKKYFSKSELLKEWKELITFINEKGKSNIAITLGIYEPELMQDFHIEIRLSNAVQQEMILEEKYMILDYLRSRLENDKIEITTKIIESEKSNIPYTNKDKFKKMLDENSQLEVLRTELGLDPDY